MRLFATYGKNFNMVSPETPGKENKTNKQRENMSYTATGVVISVGEPTQITEKLTKAELVVELPDEKYPQQVSFEVVNNNISKLDAVNEGDSVEVTFDLRGRSFNDKNGNLRYFTTLSAWGVKVLNQQEQSAEPALF